MSEERDIIERRPARLGGFAPGGYFCKCVHCDEQFTGDKRAISCLPCAISFSEAEIQRLRGEVERLKRVVAFLAPEPFSNATGPAPTTLNLQGE